MTPDPEYIRAIADSLTEWDNPIGGAEMLRATADLIEKLPKAWRTVDGKLVKDVPVVPDMDYVWVVEDRPIKTMSSLEILSRGNCGTTPEAAALAARGTP